MKIGVIIARYQIDELHDGHKSMIMTVRKEVDETVILLGCRPTKNTTKNPLNFEMRRQMLENMYGSGLMIFPINDNRDDKVWSTNLDNFLTLLFPYDSVTLYGSKDSFIPYYSGKFQTKFVNTQFEIDATAQRKQIGEMKSEDDPAFRRGVIWAAYNRYPVCFPTVDIAIINTRGGIGLDLLLGKKYNSNEWQLIGGFADPEDKSFEHSARREALEETGLEVGDMEYLGSHKVDDWRYKNVDDKIKTLLFKCKVLFGSPKAGDDIETVNWFDLHNLPNNIIKEHLPLIDLVLKSENIKSNKDA